jgi:hypothetical protein
MLEVPVWLYSKISGDGSGALACSSITAVKDQSGKPAQGTPLCISTPGFPTPEKVGVDDVDN